MVVGHVRVDTTTLSRGFGCMSSDTPRLVRFQGNDCGSLIRIKMPKLNVLRDITCKFYSLLEVARLVSFEDISRDGYKDLFLATEVDTLPELDS